ncbi:MAG: 2-C-methyl-D-erythritol 4-phosphate cytidylyltransferase [Thermoleophilia bacterium]
MASARDQGMGRGLAAGGRSEQPGRLGVVVTAGGYGRRLGLEGPKQYVLLGGQPMLARTVAALESCPEVGGLVVVVNPEDVDFCRDEVLGGAGRVLAVVGGGRERALSVKQGLAALFRAADFPLAGVHDGARPFVRPADVGRAVARLEDDPTLDGVVLGVPSTDTVKLVDEEEVVVQTPPRRRVWRAQTPQIFRTGALRQAYDVSESVLLEATDDASLVETQGGRIALVAGDPVNIKVTTPLDLQIAELLVQQEDGRAGVRGEGAGRR